MKSKWIPMIALGAAVFVALPGKGQAPAPATTNQTKTRAKKVAEATPAPTEKDVADARSKGMVWVNTNTKVYHKEGEFYGKTKKGKFMTEDEAKKAGFRAAQEPFAKKSKTGVQK